jgi:hypothetical protein
MNDNWSKREKEIARKAFNNAYDRECMALIKEIKDSNLQNSDQLWNLCDMLQKRRREMDEKYDYRYSMLIVVFARLIRDGCLNFEELEGFSQEKIEKINMLINL